MGLIGAGLRHPQHLLLPSRLRFPVSSHVDAGYKQRLKTVCNASSHPSIHFKMWFVVRPTLKNYTYLVVIMRARKGFPLQEDLRILCEEGAAIGCRGGTSCIRWTCVRVHIFMLCSSASLIFKDSETGFH